MKINTLMISRFTIGVTAVAVLGVGITWRVAVSRAATNSAVTQFAPVGEAEAISPSEPEPHKTTNAEPPRLPTIEPGRRRFHDPLEIGPCTIAPLQEQDVSSQVDGAIEAIHVELGQRVQRGELLGRLDPTSLRAQVELLQIKASSESAERIARAQYQEAHSRVEHALRANRPGLQSVPEVELESYMQQRERYAQEIIRAREEREIACKELEKARHILSLYDLRAGLSGEITKLYKRPGEVVKQMEPLFRIADFDALRVEGLCKVQQASLIRAGMHAQVEPEIRREQITALTGQTGSVTAIAVSPDGRWLASASEDHTVMLWSWPEGIRRAVLSHPAEVNALAFRPRVPSKSQRSSHELLTGCADGQIRRWTIAPSGHVTGPSVFSGGHDGAIRGIAFDREGSRFATAGEDKQVGLWDGSTGERRFWLQDGTGESAVAHQGAATMVHFTPDRHLVSVGRDNTIKVWDVSQEESARLVGIQTGRTGDAFQLGVSADGQRVLFDHGDEWRILDRRDWANMASLHSRHQGTFHALALFSPSDRLVLTALNTGRLQLWKMPATPDAISFWREASAHGMGRSSLLYLTTPAPEVQGLGQALTWLVANGSASKHQASARLPEVLPQLWPLYQYEVAFFQPPGSSSLTAAAFSPDESVLFTGGTDKVVRIWPVPGAAEWSEPLEARITFVGSQVERGSDLVRIRAELINPLARARRLRPGTYATLRVFPETDTAVELH